MNIFLTLDYELFSGPVPGTPKQCIVEPMNALSSVAEEFGIHYTIFVDAAYLLQLNRQKYHSHQLEDDYNLLINNLKALVQKGHDVQLHFHPQWMYSEWNNSAKEWQVDVKHFKLSDMDPEYAAKSFRESKQLLDSIVGYSTDCFRACGYCLESYTDYIRLFVENGIRKDSSVLRNSFVYSTVHEYDYRKIPQDHIYRFSNSVKVQDPQGGFTELSIASFVMNPFVYSFIMHKANKNYRAGRVYKNGSILPDFGDNGIIKKVASLISTRVVPASLDGISSELLPLYLKLSINSGSPNLVICGHPKNATEGSISNLKLFLDSAIKTHHFLTAKDLE